MADFKAVFGFDSTQFESGLAAAAAKAKAQAGLLQREVAAGAKDAVGGLGKDLVATFGVGAVLNELNKVAEGAARLRAAAQTTGTSTDFIQGFREAAEEGAVSIEAADAALEKFARTKGEALSGDANALKQFREIGVSVRNSNGEIKDTRDLLIEVADAIRNVGDESQRTAAVTSLLGRGAVGMTGVLARGGSALADTIDSAPKLGSFEIEALKDATKFKDDILKLGAIAVGGTVGAIRREIETNLRGLFGLSTTRDANGDFEDEAAAKAMAARASARRRADEAKRHRDALADARVNALRDAESVTDVGTPAERIASMYSQREDLRDRLWAADSAKEADDLGKTLAALNKEIAALEKSMRATRDQTDARKQDRADRSFETQLAGDERAIQEQRDAERRAKELAEIEREIAEKKTEAGKSLAPLGGGVASDISQAASEVDRRNKDRIDREKEIARLEDERREKLQQQADKARQDEANRTRASYYSARVDAINSEIAASDDPERVRALTQRRDRYVDKFDSLNVGGRFGQISEAARTMGDQLLDRADSGLVDLSKQQLDKLALIANALS